MKRVRLRFPPLPTACVVVGCSGELRNETSFCADHWREWCESPERQQLASSPTMGQEYINLHERLLKTFGEKVGRPAETP